MYKFAAATTNELIAFGSARPGYTDQQSMAWIEFMQKQGIQRVCCLLDAGQLGRYSDLLGCYRLAFGIDQVCWAPIEDFDLVDRTVLQAQILPFLAQADLQKAKVVVHCAGGVGRTGQILAAWLVAQREFSPQAAIAAVQKTGRNPYEAILAAPFKGRNPWRVAAELRQLLAECDRSHSYN
jgi:protein-tyrosine phosphatase